MSIFLYHYHKWIKRCRTKIKKLDVPLYKSQKVWMVYHHILMDDSVLVSSFGCDVIPES